MFLKEFCKIHSQKQLQKLQKIVLKTVSLFGSENICESTTSLIKKFDNLQFQLYIKLSTTRHLPSIKKFIFDN